MSESEPTKKRSRRRRRRSGGSAPVDGEAAPEGQRRRGRRGGRRRRRGGGAGEGGDGGDGGRGGASHAGTPLEQAAAIARRRFGIRSLRPEQREAIGAVLDGHDVLALLPTGFGKSLIYQVPALMQDGPTVVVSPLIALMRDQELSLQKRNVEVVRLDSTLRAAERRAALARIAEGGRLVILTTPETLESEAARPAFAQAKPSLLCVDEAHCISEWGHDFRPAYLRLGEERRALGIPRALALTATATPRVRDDIVARMQLEDPVIVQAPPHRPNLLLSAHVVPMSLKIDKAGRFIRRLTRPGIVYCATKQAVDDIYGALVRARIPCARYHGGMRAAERDEEQAKFMRPAKRFIMVATSAFGMGIDKPDIRFIMHFHVPASPEQYVQEAGRAGRDGKQSRCILLYDPADLKIQEFLQTKSRPSGAQIRRVARALAAWADEGRAVGTKDLALSAEVPQTTAKSMCAQLEEAGLIVLNEDREYASLVKPTELRAAADDLADRFEIERRQDSQRLRAIEEYVETEDCRSVFLRKWFGEEDPPPCGTCDRCRHAGIRVPGDGAGRPKRRRRGGRSKENAATGAAPRGDGAPAVANSSGGGGRKRRRRRGPRKKAG